MHEREAASRSQLYLSCWRLVLHHLPTYVSFRSLFDILQHLFIVYFIKIDCCSAAQFVRFYLFQDTGNLTIFCRLSNLYILFTACQCNGHSKCDSTNTCIACEGNTTGADCSVCAPRYYGNPVNGGVCQRK